MDYKKYKYCPHLTNYQCSFQVGDYEDLSEEEIFEIIKEVEE